MKRRVFMGFAVAAPFMTWGSADAAAVRLRASEIEELLAGNTIVGTWSGGRYRQYYAPDGATTYVPDDGRTQKGRWRTDPETHEYESWFISIGWADYAMVRLEDGGYAWINGDRLERFEVMEGNQLE